MILQSSAGGWYNNAANPSWNASGLNPVFFGFFPELEFDSFLTIGASSSLDAEHPSTIWGAINASNEFVGSNGSNVTVDDATGGAWYTPYQGVGGGQPGLAGADLRVLVAQFTTEGTMSGQIQVQVFVNGDQGEEFRDVLPLCSGDGECGGCTDETASNYDAEALYDDGSCEFGSAGCTDVAACNYTPEATSDDGSCTYPESDNVDCEGNCLVDIDCAGECGGSAVEDILGVCGGDCTADADGDGICDDEDDCVGAYDECGVCNGNGPSGDCGCDGIPAGDCDCEGNQLDACGVCGGPGEIYECGCTDIPAGFCDCNGTSYDAIGVCGGTCLADVDNDGICDDEDDCIDMNGNGICDEDEDDLDCNHDSDGDGIADCDDPCPFGDFDNDGICDAIDDCIGQVDVIGICNGHCWFDIDEDGICDDEDLCRDTDACNYNDPSNDACTYPGCTDMAACNYDAAAGCLEAGSCEYTD
jgi:hypothetical protein